MNERCLFRRDVERLEFPEHARARVPQALRDFSLRGGPVRRRRSVRGAPRLQRRHVFVDPEGNQARRARELGLGQAVGVAFATGLGELPHRRQDVCGDIFFWRRVVRSSVVREKESPRKTNPSWFRVERRGAGSGRRARARERGSSPFGRPEREKNATACSPLMVTGAFGGATLRLPTLSVASRQYASTRVEVRPAAYPFLRARRAASRSLRRRAASDSATRPEPPSIARYTASMATRGGKQAARGKKGLFPAERLTLVSMRRSVFSQVGSASLRRARPTAGSAPRTSGRLPPPTRRAMVAGYIIDYVTTARRRRAGQPPVDPNKEMLHNFVLCRLLSPRVKLLFWLTNAPYWYLCRAVVRHQLARSLGAASGPAPLWLECLRPVCGSSEVHGACVFVIAAASPRFTGRSSRLTRGSRRRASGAAPGCAGCAGSRGGGRRRRTRRARIEREKTETPPRRLEPGRVRPEDCQVMRRRSCAPTRGRKKLVERLLLCEHVRRPRVRRVSHDVRVGDAGGSGVYRTGGVHVRRRAGEATQEIQHVRGVPRAVAPRERVGDVRSVSVTIFYFILRIFLVLSDAVTLVATNGRSLVREARVARQTSKTLSRVLRSHRARGAARCVESGARDGKRTVVDASCRDDG